MPTLLRSHYSLFLMLLALGVLAFTPTASAQQTVGGGRAVYELITEGGTGGVDRYTVTVQLRADPETDFGSATLRLTFDETKVQFPSEPGVNTELEVDTDYSYSAYNGFTPPNIFYQSNATLPRSNEVSMNIVLQTTGNGAPLPTDLTDVVTLQFDVIDAGEPNFAWRANPEEPNSTEMFAEDNLTAFTIAEENFSVVDATQLPVELVSFTGLAAGPDVTLAWQTTGETNNAGFAIEQQQTGSWQEIGFVAGQGTTTATQRYEHTVAGLTQGTHRFRLKQVDLDGTFRFSEAIEVATLASGTFALSAAYPNPFYDQTTFDLSVTETQQVTVTVYDALGREVAQLYRGDLAGGTMQRLSLDAAELSSGLYLVRAHGERFTATRQVLLAR